MDLSIGNYIESGDHILYSGHFKHIMRLLSSIKRFGDVDALVRKELTQFQILPVLCMLISKLVHISKPLPAFLHLCCLEKALRSFQTFQNFPISLNVIFAILSDYQRPLLSVLLTRNMRLLSFSSYANTQFYITRFTLRIRKAKQKVLNNNNKQQ